MPGSALSSGIPAGILQHPALHSRRRRSDTRKHAYTHATFRVPARYIGDATGILDTWMDRGFDEKAP